MSDGSSATKKHPQITSIEPRECPVCCRLVATSLFSTHVGICTDRSGDCDVGVLIRIPAPRSSIVGSSSLRGSEAIAGNVRHDGYRGRSDKTQNHTNNTLEDSFPPMKGGEVYRDARIGVKNANAQSDNARGGGGGGEKQIGDDSEEEGFLQFLRPSTAAHQPNNSQYYRHYNDHYYTQPNELHHRPDGASDGLSIPSAPDAGGGAEEHSAVNTPCCSSSQPMSFSATSQSTSPATAEANNDNTNPLRYEVGLVVFEDDEANRNNAKRKHSFSSPNSEGGSPAPQPSALQNWMPSLAISAINPSPSPNEYASAKIYTPRSVSRDKVEQLMALFPSTLSLDLPRRALISHSSSPPPQASSSASPSSSPPFSSQRSQERDSHEELEGMMRIERNKEALIREALVAANDDVNVAAIILLEAGSGWAAPELDSNVDAADTIETPRGSFAGSGSWAANDRVGLLDKSVSSSSMNGGLVDVGSGPRGYHHRVVYASRGPSRSNSLSRIHTSGGTNNITVSATSQSARLNNTGLDQMDELTAALIGVGIGEDASRVGEAPQQPVGFSRNLSGRRANGGPSAFSTSGPRRPATAAVHLLPHSARGHPTTTTTPPPQGNVSITQRGRSPPPVGIATSEPSPSPSPSRGGRRVTSKVELIIYDLKPDMTVAKKLGFGAFHSGVVVYGSEIAYGGSTNLARDSGKSGIWASKPGRASAKIHERIIVGETFWKASEIRAIVTEWGANEFRVDNYHLLAANCNHFSQKFLQKLGERGRLTPDSSYFAQTYGPNGYSIALANAVASRKKKLLKQQKKEKEREREGREGNPSPSSQQGEAFAASLASNSTTTSTSASSASTSTITPLFYPQLSPDQQQVAEEVCSDPNAVKAAFQMPTYVNRAATLGNRVVPDFLFKAFMQKITAPTEADGLPTAGGAVGKARKEPISPHGSSRRNKNSRVHVVSEERESKNVESARIGSSVSTDTRIRSAASSTPPPPNPDHYSMTSDAVHPSRSNTCRKDEVSRREYESVCFIAAALGLVLSPTAEALAAAIDASPSKEDLVIPLPEPVLSKDGVFIQCLRALRAHNGDTSAALETLILGA